MFALRSSIPSLLEERVLLVHVRAGSLSVDKILTKTDIVDECSPRTLPLRHCSEQMKRTCEKSHLSWFLLPALFPIYHCHLSYILPSSIPSFLSLSVCLCHLLFQLSFSISLLTMYFPSLSNSICHFALTPCLPGHLNQPQITQTDLPTDLHIILCLLAVR